jgi:glycosyltransferase involved in cell wall biosynthesis
MQNPETFPSFSIILETENLETSDIQGLVHAIAALADQTPSPDHANEVLLIDSGDTPIELLKQLQQTYPWLQIKHAPEGTEYYDSKMLGAQWATGEIIVYYDSDCIYDRHWLESLLISFENPEIQVVSGETTTNGVGIYGTAMALCYIFPQYSGRTNLFSVTQYFLNNVAFRRSFLLENPIPVGLPLYRGNCVIHARQLIEAGHIIWRQPQARSLHAPPNGLRHFVWRFLLIGHDLYWQKKLLATRSPLAPLVKGGAGVGLGMGTGESPKNGSEVPLYKGDLGGSGPLGQSDDPSIDHRSKLAIGFDRIAKMVQRDRRHALFLPLCLPVVLVAVLLIAIGYQITCRKPHYLLKRYLQTLSAP